MIGICNIGISNISSICKMLEKIDCPFKIINFKSDYHSVEKIIIPGVGSFDEGMKGLAKKGLIEPLLTPENKKILGICLGMQLLCRKSEEGKLPGLGLIKADVIKFNISGNSIKIPHMGWNTVDVKNDNPLISPGNNSRFYFVHSYHAVCDKKENVFLTTNYGYDFVSGIRDENIYGVQFHPEKSHRYGIHLLKNFAEL